MIEILQSESGHDILRLNGKGLCSKIDPIKEAQRILARYDFTQTESVIFFGVGSGYLVLELLKQQPKLDILVLEPNENLLTQVKRVHGFEWNKVNVMTVRSRNQIIGSQQVKQRLMKPYQLITPLLSFQLYPDVFDEDLKLYLLARNKKGAEYIASIKGYKMDISTVTSEELISMKNVRIRPVDPEVLEKVNLLKELIV